MPLGALDPAALSLLAPDGRLIEGPPPTKEVPLHDAIYATAYYLMRVGRTALIPYCRPGDPLVAHVSLEAAGWAIEELEQTARLMLLLRGERPTSIDAAEAAALRAGRGLR